MVLYVPCCAVTIKRKTKNVIRVRLIFSITGLGKNAFGEVVFFLSILAVLYQLRKRESKTKTHYYIIINLVKTFYHIMSTKSKFFWRKMSLSSISSIHLLQDGWCITVRVKYLLSLVGFFDASH